MNAKISKQGDIKALHAYKHTCDISDSLKIATFDNCIVGLADL